MGRAEARTGTGTGPPSASTAYDPPSAPPATYTWHFYVDRDDHDRLRLFFYEDPDVGNTYAMSRPTPGHS